MSKKVRNLFFAGKTVQISSEVVTFDENGIGVVESDELAAEVVHLKGYDDPDENGIGVVESDELAAEVVHLKGYDDPDENGIGVLKTDVDEISEGEAQDNTSDSSEQQAAPSTPVRQPAAVRRVPSKSNK